MIMNWSDAIRHDVLQLRADRMAGGHLTFYTAPKPAIGAAITTQTALHALSIPVGLTAVDNSLTLLFSSVTLAIAGEAAWGRITGPSDEFVLDGDCGLLASTALFRLKTTAFAVGAVLTTIVASFAEA